VFSIVSKPFLCVLEVFLNVSQVYRIVFEVFPVHLKCF